MIDYKEFKTYADKLLGDFPIYRADSDEILIKLLDKEGIKLEEVTEIQENVYIERWRVEDFNIASNKVKDIFEKLVKEDEFLIDAFKYGLYESNYHIKGNTGLALEMCGCTLEDLSSNIKLSRLFLKAKDEYHREIYNTIQKVTSFLKIR